MLTEVSPETLDSPTEVNREKEARKLARVPSEIA